MTESIIQFSKFAESFNQNEETQVASLQEIKSIEDTLNIKLPEDFKLFMSTFGDLWTPDILDLIDDNDLDMNDVQQFWLPAEIVEDKMSGFTNQIKEDLIPFASDCMGNIYVFKTADIGTQKSSAKVHFFDHDLDKLYPVANSFTELIEEFNSLI